MSRRSRPKSERTQSGRERPAPESPRRVRLHAMLLVLAVVVTYANSVTSPFVLDDQASIVQNPDIRDLRRLDRVLVPAPESPVAGRPIVSLSFALNYAVSGVAVGGYHVWNIGVHALCALLLYGIVARTLAWPRIRARLVVEPATLAFAASLIWAVHPLASEVVDYLTQRTESMMAMFYLLTMYASIRALDPERSRRWAIVAVAACAAGMACKESMASAPLMVAVYDRVFAFGSWRETLRRRRGLYAGLIATWVVLAVVTSTSPRGRVAGFSSGVSAWTYLLNQTVMIVHYLRLTVWPDTLVVFYGWPMPLTLSDVFPYGVVVVLLLLATLVALVRVPALGFVGAWFFVTLAPASSVIPIATEVGAERRMYLPLAALAVLAVIGGHEVVRRARIPIRAAAGLLAVVTVALAAATIVRNRDYSSGIRLAQTVVDRRPTSVAYHMLGEQLMLSGRTTEAIPLYRQAVALGNSRAAYTLGALLYNEKQWAESIEQFDAFVRTASLPYPLVPRWLEPSTNEVLISRLAMARAFAAQQKWPQASEQAQLILRVVPEHPQARRLLADALYSQERWVEAVTAYRTYLTALPEDVEALMNCGVALIGTGNAGGLKEAAGLFERALKLDPGNQRAQQLLALARKDLNDLGEQAPR